MSLKYSLPFRLSTLSQLAISIGLPLVFLEEFSKKCENNNDPIIKFTKKTKGKERDVSEAQDNFKKVYKLINELFQLIEIPKEINGAVTGCNTSANAEPHVGSQTMIKLDIENFFPSIKKRKIKDMMVKIGCSPLVSKALTNISTIDNKLPQGLSFSSTIANLYLLIFCFDRMKTFTDQHKLTITIWVDDITISSENRLTDSFSALIVKKFNSILESAGLKLNRKKTRIIIGGKRRLDDGSTINEASIVTGLVTDKKLNILSSVIRKYRSILNALRTRTPEQVIEDKLKNEYEESRKKSTKADWLSQHLRGKMSYIKNINPQKYYAFERSYGDVFIKFNIKT